mmetsp:Transcript_645/g.2354  ORF Transcript_645/g.2354 Transcript_645/m.2354 type:complete len:255 (+) Transcript_645:1734-2498(+)
MMSAAHASSESSRRGSPSLVRSGVVKRVRISGSPTRNKRRCVVRSTRPLPWLESDSPVRECANTSDGLRSSTREKLSAPMMRSPGHTIPCTISATLSPPCICRFASRASACTRPATERSSDSSSCAFTRRSRAASVTISSTSADVCGSHPVALPRPASRSAAPLEKVGIPSLVSRASRLPVISAEAAAAAAEEVLLPSAPEAEEIGSSGDGLGGGGCRTKANGTSVAVVLPTACCTSGTVDTGVPATLSNTSPF